MQVVNALRTIASKKPIEVEVENLTELAQALDAAANIIAG